jgi:hypothetical protein
MGYEEIDSVLEKWAQARLLHMYRLYQDEEVRSFDVVNENAERFQIWVDLPESNQIKVHIWDYKKKKKDFLASKDTLFRTLDAAYDLTTAWEH